MDLVSYYSKKEVQDRLLEVSKDREVSVIINEGFGKHPDILQYPSDIIELARSGAVSFHISEEHWKNPLLLKPGMTKRELDDLRISWDLILDIDGPFELSRIASYLVTEALEFNDMKNYTVKFSGNKGFHIAIPFSAFPKKVQNKDTKDLFPEAPKIIASHLKEIIKKELSGRINNDDPYSLVDIDTILISNRHMFRAPYSYHEKSGLISIPVRKEEILSFERESARPENVKFDVPFLSECSEGEASRLIIQAFDWNLKNLKSREKDAVKTYDEFSKKVPGEFFPDSIKKGLEGVKDGRKRFLFILLNFLRCLNYNYDEISEIVKKWNEKNDEPLREGYIATQLMWHKKQKKILPPNFTNKMYYQDLGIEISEREMKFKNPVNLAVRMFKLKHR